MNYILPSSDLEKKKQWKENYLAKSKIQFEAKKQFFYHYFFINVWNASVWDKEETKVHKKLKIFEDALGSCSSQEF